MTALKNLITVVSVCGFIGISNAKPAEIRSWTNTKGKKITAKYISSDGKVAVLESKFGKKMNVPIATLSKADAEYIQKQMADGNAAGKGVKVATPKGFLKPLPNKEHSEGMACHAVYKGDKYVAKLMVTGGIHVYLPDSIMGEDKKAMDIFASTHDDLPQGKRKYYPLKSIENGGEPAVNPDKVEFTAVHIDGVKHHVVYEFTPKGITAWMHSEVGKATLETSRHWIRWRMLGIKAYDQDVDMHKKMKFTKERADGKGKDYKVNFYEIATIHGPAAEAKFSGPAYGKTKIKIEHDAENENSVLNCYNYPDTPLGNGFTFFFTQEDHTSKDHDKEKVTITFK